MERDSSSTNGNGLLFVSRPSADKRSVSPLTPSPTQKLRGVRLFRAISRRLGGRRSRQESRSPSSDSDSDRSSSSGDGGGNRTDDRRDAYHSCSSSGDQHSNSGSDTSSGNSSSGNSSGGQTSPSGNSSEGSSGVSSIRRVFQSLSLNGRSQNRKGRPKKAPKKILRAPVTYTYVKGLSGLPTQRVPKGFQCPCVYLPIPLHAAFLGTTGLNR